MRTAARWSLLALLLTAVAAALAAQGLSTRTTGPSRTPFASGGRGILSGARPILQWSGERLVSREEPPGRRIALTFDDGPDPRWTPRIAATLRRLHVPATFFVIGSKVVRHRALVRSLYRQGFELGARSKKLWASAAASSGRPTPPCRPRSPSLRRTRSAMSQRAAT